MRSLLSRYVSAVLLGTAPVGCWGAAAPVASRESAEAAKRSWSAEMRAGLGFEDGAFWSGGVVVSEPRRSGAGAMRWERHEQNPGLECRLAPLDLSAFNVMSFWLHSSHANDATFMIIAESRDDENVFSYYSRKVRVDWTGWRRLEVHFQSFGAARGPVGWHRVSRLRFTAGGWDQHPTNESVWVLDDLDFSYTDTPYRAEIRVQKYLQEPAKTEYLARLRAEHPRLILLDDEIPALRQFLTEDPRGRVWYESTRARAEEYRRRPVRKHELPDGRRLLSVSRDVCERLYHWGLLYRLEGDRVWLDRAREEMEAVVAFPDWNPSHYLDTAEMMHAVGLGYDWFYDGLTGEQRGVIREGLWRHGLRLSHAAYMGLRGEGAQGWRGVTNNWNFVCNGGTAVAAMAVLDEMPEECSDILDQSFQYIQIPIRQFEPDGAWWEGLGYWGYSMRYFLAYLRALETAFGTDFGFVAALQGTGFAKAGDFPVYLVSPLGSIYNFADSGSGSGTFQHWGLFYLADRFRNPLYQHFQLERSRGSIHDILYYRPQAAEIAVQDVPLDKHFRETEVATMRSSWTDREATFLGIKCGRNGIAHAHQDLGSFIFHALGEPWLIDPGTERQTYLSHQHHLPKSHFYRIREEGHNTLVFDPAAGFCQDPGGRSSVVRFESCPQECFAVADLTHAYGKVAASVMRGYRLLDQRRACLVQDEIRNGTARELWWFAHAGVGTVPEVDASGRRAVFERNGRRCYAYLLSPEGVQFTAMAASPLPTSPNPEIQDANRGMHKLGIHWTAVTDVTIAVLFAPAYDFESEPALRPEVAPLASWALPEAKLPALAGLTVGGEPLPDFSPRVYSYTVRLDPEVTEPPSVAATGADGAAVSVSRVGSVPGACRIAVADPEGGPPAVTLVRFLHRLPAGSTEKPQAKSKTVTVGGITVSASRDDGNVPQNVLDGDPETRWSASGSEEWIGFDFGAPRRVSALRIAWFSGDQRQTRFKVSASDDGAAWRDVLEGESGGKTTQPEVYNLPAEISSRHLRITCFGNTSNLWNSITEIGFD
ncbi:MAG: discoidin domain-containing protein [Lentisphaeria bacterium]|nr:discoidin domain-containing protein [Lentisphaeria bacterium]